jgi:hydroxymethylpyrimidine pyrophosphatase-like HAD family hydrolase
MDSKRVIALFDVDGTLTPARDKIEQPMMDCLKRVTETGVTCGIVSGSDLNKLLEQIPEESKIFSSLTPKCLKQCLFASLRMDLLLTN